MLTIIAITLSILVIFNFLLLKFSCNETPKTEQNKKIVIEPNFTIEEEIEVLASTGS